MKDLTHRQISLTSSFIVPKIYIEIFEKSTRCGNLITFGDILLHKEDKKNESYCYQAEDKFDYHGIEKALCGKTQYYNDGWKGEYFKPKRILVIQMK